MGHSTYRGPNLCKFLFFALAAAAAVTQPACGVAFRFDAPPKPSASADPVARCVAQNQIVVRPAKARWVDRGGEKIEVQTMYEARGLTFYRGGRRLDVEELFEVVEAPRLASAYRHEYAGRKRKGFVQRVVGWVLLGTAAAGLATGSALLYAGVAPDPKDKTLTYTGLGIGIAGLLIAIPAGYLLRAGYRHADAARAYRTIFMVPAMTDELAAAVKRYNERVVAECRRSNRSTPIPKAPRPGVDARPARPDATDEAQ